MTFLIDIQDESITDDVLESIVKMCQYMHSSVIEASDLYLKVRQKNKIKEIIFTKEPKKKKFFCLLLFVYVLHITIYIIFVRFYFFLNDMLYYIC